MFIVTEFGKVGNSYFSGQPKTARIVTLFVVTNSGRSDGVVAPAFTPASAT